MDNVMTAADWRTKFKKMRKRHDKAIEDKDKAEAMVNNLVEKTTHLLCMWVIFLCAARSRGVSDLEDLIESGIFNGGFILETLPDQTVQIEVGETGIGVKFWKDPKVFSDLDKTFDKFLPPRKET